MGLQRDSLDRLLQVHPAVQVVTTVWIDTVRIPATAPVTSDSGDAARRATFVRYVRPATLTATVVLPRAPGVGTLDATVVIDSMPLELRIGCGAKTRGVRSASASVSGPAWARVGLAAVRTDPDVCNAISELRVPGGVPWYVFPAVGLVSFAAGAVMF